MKQVVNEAADFVGDLLMRERFGEVDRKVVAHRADSFVQDLFAPGQLHIFLLLLQAGQDLRGGVEQLPLEQVFLLNLLWRVTANFSLA